MGQRSCLVLCSLLSALVALPAVGAGTQHSLAPVAVSPGSGEEFALLDQRCPTFSWGAIADVRAWEIAVFAVADATAVTDGAAKRVVSHLLPGSVTSWTATGSDCLSEGRYAWVVRARRAAGPSTWSPARLFEVATRPPEADHQIYSLIERYIATRPAPEAEGVGVEAEGETVAPASDPEKRGSALGGADFSVDSTGNVVASSFAGDGSGLTGVDAATLDGEAGAFYRAWANLTGVPGGFADGIDNDSDTLALLSCTEGQIARQGAAGWACADDGDTFAQLGCAADEVPQYNGAAWTCTALTVDNVGAMIPAAPTHLRIGPEYRFPGMRRLAWNMASLGGVASFVVYQSDFPITDGNKADVRRQVTPTLYAAVDLFPNTGIQHFRVEAQNVLGEAGPLSPEITVDTTSRLAYVGDYEGAFAFNLYAVPAVPGATKIQVNDPFFEYYRWAWSPDGLHLGYSSNQGTYSGIHVVPATGGTPVRVDDPSAGGLWGYSWSWSPDGSRIAYRANPAGTELSWQLWTVPATGGSAVRVNDPATTEVAEIPNLAWSPDGSRLLYGGASGPGHIALLSAPATGGGQTELSGAFPPGAAGVTRAAWSPDGSRVAYLADQETVDLDELWVVGAAGGSPLKINPPIAAGGGVFRFSWSPDGTRLAYTADIEGNTVAELFVAAAVGGPSQRLNEDLVADGDVGLFEWSPDGKLIVYTADLTVDNLYEQRVVPAAGGAGWRVSPTDSRGDPVSSSGTERWSPDGEHLAFVSAGELYVTTTQGTELRKLSGTMVPGGSVAFARWSPDGSRIAYQADQDTDDLQELYMVGINGGGAAKLNDPFGAGLMGVNGPTWSPLGN